MTTMTDIDTTDATAVATPAQQLMATATTLARALRKLDTLETTTVAQRGAIAEAKQAVTNALNGDGDFDEASRVFRTANNKLDRLLEQRDDLITSLDQDITGLRITLDGVAELAKHLEA